MNLTISGRGKQYQIISCKTDTDWCMGVRAWKKRIYLREIKGDFTEKMVFELRPEG